MVDVTSNVSLKVNSWTLNRSTGALIGRATLKNIGPAAIANVFRMAITPSNRLRLTTVNGYFGPMTYLDITNQVVPQLSTTGNHDAKLDKGESVNFTFSIFTLDRVPSISPRFLGQYANMPAVTLMADPQYSSIYGGEGSVRVNFTRSGDPSAGPLTVYYSTGGTAVAGTDYTANAGSVTIPTGNSTIQVSFNTLMGNSNNNVTLTVTTTPNGNYTVGSPSQASLIIIHTGG